MASIPLRRLNLKAFATSRNQSSKVFTIIENRCCGLTHKQLLFVFASPQARLQKDDKTTLEIKVMELFTRQSG